MAFAQPITKSMLDKFKGNSSSSNNCNKVCSMVLTPVCGSDGNTYGNPCMFDNTNCKAGGKLTSKPGKCPVGAPNTPTQGNCPPGQHLVIINPNRCIKPGGPCTKVGTRSECRPIQVPPIAPKTPPPGPSKTCPPGQRMVYPNYCPPGANCSLIDRGPSYCAPNTTPAKTPPPGPSKTCPPGQHMVNPNNCPPGGKACPPRVAYPSYCAPNTS